MIETRGASGSGRSEGILRAVALAARRLAREEWQEVVREVLHLLGNAAEVSRAYVFENSTADDGGLMLSERYEWCRPGVHPTIHDASNQNYPYRPDFARWERVLGGGTTIFGLARDFPEPEQKDMRTESILSTVIVPIFAGKQWWGFIGFDDCVHEREWTEVELDALEAASETLGAAIARETTERQRREAEARYEALVENIPAVVYMSETGGEGEWIYVSNQIEEMLGYSPQEWLDHPAPFGTHVHPDDLDRTLAAEEAAKATEDQILQQEYRMYTRDGKLIWVRDQSRPVRDETGKTLYLQGIMLDITRQRDAENKLRELQSGGSAEG